MKLIYNGVVLEMFEIQQYTREAVYSSDGVDLLYHKHRVTALLHVTPHGVSMRKPQGPTQAQADANEAVRQAEAEVARRQRALELAENRVTAYPDRDARRVAVNQAAVVRATEAADTARAYADSLQVFGKATYPDTEEFTPARLGLRSGPPSDVQDPAGIFINPDEELLALAPAVQPAAFLTDHELRARLMMPRRRLYLTAHDIATGHEKVWVKAPRFDPKVAVGPSGSDPNRPREFYPYSDAANGPTPLRCDVIQPTGEGTYLGVLYTVEFNLVPVDPEFDKLILSHRWQINHTSDEDHYLVKEIIGEVVANGELLRSFNQSIDWYRNQFFHPIPLGFIRSIPQVQMSPDGLTIRYTIRDRDPEVMFDPGDSGATHLDIQETVNYLTPDPVAVGTKVGTTIGGALSGIPFIGPALAPLGGAIGGSVGAVTGRP